ncbi:MAG: putative inorganic carbon transporter subunit DabA, partial [Myxococcota bacterium]
SGLDLYLHRLLLRVGGWSAFTARIVWDRNLLDGEQDDTLVQFLCILVSWEAAMLACLDEDVEAAWATHKVRKPSVDLALERTLILQRALERAAQRQLEARFAARTPPSVDRPSSRPLAQAIFCIDVRSEVFRRHLEAASEDIETLGFAGFFAFPIEHVPLAHQKGGAQCPVLLTPAARVSEGLSDPTDEAKALQKRHLKHEVERAWKSFKMGAVSCFSFVGAAGLAYLPKLFTDAFGWTRPVAHPAEEGLGALALKRDVHLEYDAETGTGIPLERRIELAAGALGGMSLKEGFARLVFIAGHGSTTVNNPHATGLDCGACGGRTGEANARVAAHILNDQHVRDG